MKPILPLALAALAAALPLAAQTAPPATGPLASEKLGWKLAVHSYTFQRFDIYQAIDKTAAMGVKYMSVSGGINLPDPQNKFKSVQTVSLPDKDFAAITAHMKEKGLDPNFVNMGVVRPGIKEAESRKIFEAAKKMGIGVLVAEPETHNKMEELGPVMDVVEKLAKEYNIKVAIHNHPGPNNFYWNPDTILTAVKGRSPLLGSCADVGHWVRSGLDPVECLKKLEGRVITLHFKDLNERSPKAHDVPWGTGASNAKAMLVEMKRQEFKGAFCVEYEHNWETSAPEIEQSAKWFEATCAELAGK